jgi:hypothetical protein
MRVCPHSPRLAAGNLGMFGFGRNEARTPRSTRAVEEFRLELPLGDAYRACREAIARIGLEVDSVDTTRIVTRRGVWGFGRDPARIEAWLFRGEGYTSVTLDGRILGRSARSRGRLKGELLQLRTAVEVAAHGAPAHVRAARSVPASPRGLSSAPARP